MSTMSLRSSVAFCLLAAALFTLGCDTSGTESPEPPTGETGTNGADAGKKRFILLTNGNSPFWDACRFGLKEAEKTFNLAEAGLTAIMEVNDGTPKGQIDKLRQFGSQSDVVGVAISALDAANAAVANEMKNLRQWGVHVVTVDADVDRQKFRDARSYYLGTDNLTGGRELGVAARKLLESRKVTSGSYVQFVGRTGSHNAIERMDGFKEKVGSNYKEADRMGDDIDLARAQENVRNAIRNHPDLVALVGIWSYNAPAIAQVVTAENKRDKYTIVTFDAEPGAIKNMGEGKIDVMVVQNPYNMGYYAVKLLKAMHEKDSKTIQEMFPKEGQPDGDLYDTGLKVVVPDTGGPLKQELFGAKTQYMKLGEFKKWLDQYNLTGS